MYLLACVAVAMSRGVRVEMPPRAINLSSDTFLPYELVTSPPAPAAAGMASNITGGGTAFTDVSRDEQLASVEIGTRVLTI